MRTIRNEHISTTEPVVHSLARDASDVRDASNREVEVHSPTAKLIAQCLGRCLDDFYGLC